MTKMIAPKPRQQNRNLKRNEKVRKTSASITLSCDNGPPLVSSNCVLLHFHQTTDAMTFDTPGSAIKSTSQNRSLVEGTLSSTPLESKGEASGKYKQKAVAFRVFPDRLP